MDDSQAHSDCSILILENRKLDLAAEQAAESKTASNDADNLEVAPFRYLL